VLHRQYGLSEQRANQPLWLYTSDPDFDGFLRGLWCSPAVAKKRGLQYDNKCFLSLPPTGLIDLADARAETSLLDYEEDYAPPPLDSEPRTLADRNQPAGQPAQPPPAAPPQLVPPTVDLGAVLGNALKAALPLLNAALQAPTAAAPADQAAQPALPPAVSSNQASPAPKADPPPGYQ
jgi:hypothetical protein